MTVNGNRNLPVRYDDLSISERRAIREEYTKIQGGSCYYCGAPLSGKAAKKVRTKPINRSLFPPKFFTYPIHLHHSHETRMTIGAVHSYCNAVLWQYENE